jgi:hypothetical protein
MFQPLAIRYYFRLLAVFLIFAVLVTAAGILFPPLFNLLPALLLTGCFALAAFASLLIFFNGFFAGSEKSVFMTLIALGVKMLLSFVFALLFFLVFKNDSTGSLILFFILYLAFTFYVVHTFVSVLKKKSD